MIVKTGEESSAVCVNDLLRHTGDDSFADLSDEAVPDTNVVQGGGRMANGIRPERELGLGN
ncbi:hypothetical protein JOF28_002538 [Leucobacter exalbidus]|uniref:Uncharacterized protein n=1 Tax=Leucobacter exalbidus TaxID=662960 RepID=A0A940PYB5_9MICO|nr:hypothetical protein [Leucobacter exalbidus]MBP1327306.1 hypothetical protein [Leucobacter exalbidus]